MTSLDEPDQTTAGEHILERTNDYIYLGQLITIDKDNQTAEITR